CLQSLAESRVNLGDAIAEQRPRLNQRCSRRAAGDGSTQRGVGRHVARVDRVVGLNLRTGQILERHARAQTPPGERIRKESLDVRLERWLHVAEQLARVSQADWRGQRSGT